MSAKLPFKARLRGAAPLHGFFIGVPAPATVELAGYAGFDFVIIDTEHGAAGLETLEHMLRAATASGIAALVRVPRGGADDILHVLDAGADGILVPHVTGAARAAEIVRHAYYPPLGRRGISTLSRAARHGMGDPAAMLREQADRTAVIAMIEDAEALSEVGAVARVPGLDAIFVGPNDLASSMGHLGDSSHPTVVRAVTAIREELQSIPGGPAFATIARNGTQARELAAQGARMLCFNTTYILGAALKALHADISG
ncbi:HpcH/HpaI aldolase family protein [Neoroseomonas lacus]|uniref:Aldolase n=1 Tax=Neoroseomonas lacus TaxID=287609 RepID=A0A917L4N6_9PROT|nr:aldolase/citrate lyase family protein [Neoroseomonas lacus]GGJ41925.1 aldolase [Neoroseomonas lacus]